MPPNPTVDSVVAERRNSERVRDLITVADATRYEKDRGIGPIVRIPPRAAHADAAADRVATRDMSLRRCRGNFVSHKPDTAGRFSVSGSCCRSLSAPSPCSAPGPTGKVLFHVPQSSSRESANAVAAQDVAGDGHHREPGIPISRARGQAIEPASNVSAEPVVDRLGREQPV